MDLLNSETTRSILLELMAIRIGLQYILDGSIKQAPELKTLAKLELEKSVPVFSRRQYKERTPTRSEDITISDDQETWRREVQAELGDDTDLMKAFADAHGLQAYLAARQGLAEGGNAPAVDLYQQFANIAEIKADDKRWEQLSSEPQELQAFAQMHGWSMYERYKAYEPYAVALFEDCARSRLSHEQYKGQ